DRRDAGRISARATEACDEAIPDRVATAGENDRNRRGCRLGRECRAWSTGCDDHRHLTANQVCGQPRQPIVVALRPAIFDCHVLTLDEAGLFQALAERGYRVRKRVRRPAAQEPDHRRRRLLRARRERPRRRCAADKRGEGAPPDSITSSARASSVAGISRPSILAVSALMTSSNLLD